MLEVCSRYDLFAKVQVKHYDLREFFGSLKTYYIPLREGWLEATSQSQDAEPRRLQERIQLKRIDIRVRGI